MTTGRQPLEARKQPRQARAELTRQRILAAAAQVFAEHGYAAGTTNRIAERARISIGSLYQYYPNKDAILLELMTRHLEIDEGPLLRVGEPLPDSVAEIVRGYVRLAVDNHRDDPQLLRVMMEQTPRSAELLAKVSRRQQARVAAVRDVLDRHPQVRVGDTHTAARLVVSTIELVVHSLIAAPDPVDLARFESELVAMLTNYLTTEPPA